MQSANLIGAFWAISVAILIYTTLVIALKKYCSRDLNAVVSANAYVKYMVSSDRGFTQCKNMQTRSGECTSTFFDVDNWLSISSNLEYATSWIVKKILEIQSEASKNNVKISGLAFIEKDSGPTGLISIQYLIAKQTRMKTCTIRLRRWPFLPQAAVKGDAPLKGSNWILVSDVATTGGHIIKASKVLNNECWGANCSYSIVLLLSNGHTSVEKDFQNEHKIKLFSNEPLCELYRSKLESCEQTNCSAVAA